MNLTEAEIKLGLTADACAIDFETYYGKDYSIAKMSTYQYVHHPEFDAYMVTLFSPDLEYVGNPANFDWHRLDGATLIAHNASFDQRVFERLQDLGTIPKIKIKRWICTADMVVYFQYPRTLKGSAKEVLGVEMSKEVRGAMKGKTWDDLVAMDMAKDVMEYALDDARYCYELYDKLFAGWPQVEQDVSEMTRDMSYCGMPGAEAKLDDRVESLQTQLFEAKQRLPWYMEIDPDTKKSYAVYSKKALALECRKVGIDPPKSLDKASADWKEWEAKHGEQITYASDMQNVQRINKHLQTLIGMRNRLTDKGRISYNMMYWGAGITGRFSGAGGFNVQNMPRGPQYGVDVRSCIEAPEGFTLLIVDLAQIEARLTAWLAEDYEFLETLADGMSPYEAHARLTMGWTGGVLKDEDPELYMLAKVRVLQLGYGSGWFKFAETVKNYGQQSLLDRDFSKRAEIQFKEFAGLYQPGKATLYPTLSTFDRRQWVNAYLQVDDFRRKNPGITSKWKHHDRLLKGSVGETYSFDLPSGREMRFHSIKQEADGVTAKAQQGSPRRTYFYGANIFQNSVQGTARDLFAWQLAKLSKDYKIVLHVHDEVVIEIEEDRAEAGLADVIKTMSSGPEWISEVPLAAEGQISKEYVK